MNWPMLAYRLLVAPPAIAAQAASGPVCNITGGCSSNKLSVAPDRILNRWTLSNTLSVALDRILNRWTLSNTLPVALDRITGR